MDRDKMNRDGATILVRVGGTLDKISYEYINSTKALYCNGVTKISVRKGDIKQKCIHQIPLKNFEKFIRNLHKIKKLSKIFQN